MVNWEEFIYDKFSDKSEFVLEKFESDEEVIFIIKGFNLVYGPYLKIESDKFNKKQLVKLEFGSDDSEVTCKAIFNSQNKFNLEFRQCSWFEEASKRYGLDYSKDNLKKLKDFLKIPIERVWTEEQFYYENNPYKVSISINIGGRLYYSNFLLSSFSEQNIPLPLDNILRKLNRIIIEGVNKKKIYSKKVSIPGFRSTLS